MTPDPQTGLVAVLDLAATEPAKGKEAGPPVTIKMFPVDWKETRAKSVVLPSGAPRFVLAESYVPPEAT